MESQVLVTGATGFVGSFVVEELIKKGYSVLAMVRNKNNVKWLNDVKPDLLEGTLDEVPPIPHSVTRIIHVAGVTKARNLKEFMAGNQILTQNLLTAIRKQNLKIERFIHISSQAAAGPSKPQQPRTEADTPRPVTWYGISKLEAEKTVLAYNQHFPVTIIRPPAVYGPRDKDVLNIFRFVKSGLNLSVGKGNQPVSMIYVKNLARGIVQSLENENASGKIFFLTDGPVLPLNRVIQLMGNIMGKKYITISIPFSLAKIIASVIEWVSNLTGQQSILNRQKIIEVNQPSWACSDALARQVFEYEPAFTPEEGIAETYHWYKQQGWL